MQLMKSCGTLDEKKSKTLLKKVCGKRPRFEDDGGHDDKKESLCSTSVRKRKKSVTFDLSGLLEMLSMNGTEIPITRLTTKQYGRKIERTEGCDTTDNSLTSGDNPDLLGLPVQSTSSPSEGRRPKGIKYWLKDPHVYVVNPHDSNYPCLLI